MNEFSHYSHYPQEKDLVYCVACRLLYSGEEGPNISNWPLVFIANNRSIPTKYYKALRKELNSDNKEYVTNLKNKLAQQIYEEVINGCC